MTRPGRTVRTPTLALVFLASLLAALVLLRSDLIARVAPPVGYRVPGK